MFPSCWTFTGWWRLIDGHACTDDGRKRCVHLRGGLSRWWTSLFINTLKPCSTCADIHRRPSSCATHHTTYAYSHHSSGTVVDHCNLTSSCQNRWESCQKWWGSYFRLLLFVLCRPSDPSHNSDFGAPFFTNRFGTYTQTRLLPSLMTQQKEQIVDIWSSLLTHHRPKSFLDRMMTEWKVP